MTQAERRDDDDAQVASRFRQGDLRALGTLYERYFPSVAHLLAARVGDWTAAEDLAQSAFLRAWERRSSLNDPRRFRAWLFALARNLAFDHLRRMVSQPLDHYEGVVSNYPEPEATAMSNELGELFSAAASSLEPRQLEILDLSVRMGLSSGEVAQVVGVSAPHAAVLVHRAKQALQGAIRALLVAGDPDRCSRLQELVPDGLVRLTPEQRRTVDHHMRRCQACRRAAGRLSSPLELFGALPLLSPPTSWSSTGPQALLERIGHSASVAAGHVGLLRRFAKHPVMTGGAVGTAAAVAAVTLLHGGAPPAPPPGRILVTGDDPDVHAHDGANAIGARHVLENAIRYVTRDKGRPHLLLVTDLRDPGHELYRDPRLGVADAGYAADVADSGSPAPGVRDLHQVRFQEYDAIIVASDLGGWLRQDELDILNARKSDLASFLRGGGGLVALAEGGAGAIPGTVPLTTRGRLAFLPVTVQLTAVNQTGDGVTITDQGRRLGLRPEDETGNYRHSTFRVGPGAVILEVDQKGEACAFAATVQGGGTPSRP